MAHDTSSGTIPPTSRPPRMLARMGRDYALILPGFFISLVAFVLLVPLATLSLATLIIYLGVFLLPVTLRLASVFAQLSRARVRNWGAELPPARYATRQPGWSQYMRLLVEPRRWADLAFETLIAFPLHIFTFCVAVTWTAGALGGITYAFWGLFLPANDLPLPGLILEAVTNGAASAELAHSFLLDAGFNFVCGLILLLTLPVVLRGLARLDVVVTAAALGGAPAGSVPASPKVAQAPDSISPSISPSAAPSSAPSTSWPAPTVAAASWSGERWAWISAAFLAVVSTAVGWPVLAAIYGVNVAIAMLIMFAHAAALLLAVRWPVAGVLLQTGAALATAFATVHAATALPWPWPVMTLLVQVALVLLVSLRNRWFWGAFAWAAPAFACLIVALSYGVDGGGWSSIIVTASVSAGALALGVVVRLWAESRGALRDERQTSAELSARGTELQERNRIAQELHDVVAHSMSVISVQATTAKYRLPGLDTEVERELESIAGSSRQALTEMRSLLTLLRSPDEDRDLQLVPQPTLADIPSLVESTRNSGVQIALTVSGPDSNSDGGDSASAPSAAAGLTAYRIIQEALSNAMRHAPGSAIDVSVDVSPSTVTVTVENGPADAASTQPAAPGAGLGLAGVRERVAALGGSVEAGPTDLGGFRVQALLELA